MMVRLHITQQHGRAINGVDDDVDFSIVEEISNSRSPRWNQTGKPRSHDRRNVFKLAITSVMKEQRPLGITRAPVMVACVRIDVPVDLKEVFPSVVVVVDE